MSKKKVLGLAATVVVVAAGVALAVLVRRQMAERRELDARGEMYVRFGVDAPPTELFPALPALAPHNAAAASIGATLFTKPGLVAQRGKVCAACHRLNSGGVDNKRHGKILTRTVNNAFFADVFMNDGSVRGYPAIVEKMISDPRFCGAGPIDAVVAKLAANAAVSNRFSMVYDAGLTATNLVDAFVQYGLTLVSERGAYDLFRSGRPDALSDEAKRGFEIFRANCAECHYGPALGMQRVHEGRKVPGLRGLSSRKAYLTDGTRTDLPAVLAFMPGGDIDVESDRLALLAFLREL